MRQNIKAAVWTSSSLFLLKRTGREETSVAPCSVFSRGRPPAKALLSSTLQVPHSPPLRSLHVAFPLQKCSHPLPASERGPGEVAARLPREGEGEEGGGRLGPEHSEETTVGSPSLPPLWLTLSLSLSLSLSVPPSLSLCPSRSMIESLEAENADLKKNLGLAGSRQNELKVREMVGGRGE